jgi:hypothetical protein
MNRIEHFCLCILGAFDRMEQTNGTVDRLAATRNACDQEAAESEDDA